nr:hypothetical protein [Tanacetum cinerariifolium]
MSGRTPLKELLMCAKHLQECFREINNLDASPDCGAILLSGYTMEGKQLFKSPTRPIGVGKVMSWEVKTRNEIGSRQWSLRIFDLKLKSMHQEVGGSNPLGYVTL